MSKEPKQQVQEVTQEQAQEVPLAMQQVDNECFILIPYGVSLLFQPDPESSHKKPLLLKRKDDQLVALLLSEVEFQSCLQPLTKPIAGLKMIKTPWHERMKAQDSLLPEKQTGMLSDGEGNFVW